MLIQSIFFLIICTPVYLQNIKRKKLFPILGKSAYIIAITVNYKNIKIFFFMYYVLLEAPQNVSFLF